MWSIVIPVLNEASVIQSLLASLQSFREAGHEIILVDGGSTDETLKLAQPLVDQWKVVRPGRGSQLNQGVALSSGDWLWFLHADSVLSASLIRDFGQLMACVQNDPGRYHSILDRQQVYAQAKLDRELRKLLGKGWGRFDIGLTGAHPLLRLVERAINLRSTITSVCTGDQGIFVRKDLFYAVGGFPEWPMMEDIALSSRLKRHRRAYRLKTTLLTSSRRWEQTGIVKTIIQMWCLRAAYYFGVSPARLSEYY